MGAVGSAGRLVVTVAAPGHRQPGARAAARASPSRRSSCRHWRASVERRPEEAALAGPPPGPPPVRARDRRRPGQGAAGRRRRSGGRRPAPPRCGVAGTTQCRRTRWATRGVVRRRRGPSFGLGYVGRRRLGGDRARRLRRRRPARARRRRQPVAATWASPSANESEFLRWTLDAVATARLARGLRRRPRRGRPTPGAGTARPTASRFEGVSFAYPGTDRLVLDDVDLTPAGRLGRRPRRRERRRQDDAGQAAVPVLRADRRGGSPSTAPTWPASRPTSGASGCPARSRTSSGSSTSCRRNVGVGDLAADRRPRAGPRGRRPRRRRRRRRAPPRGHRHPARRVVA